MASIKKDFIDSLKRRIDSDPNALLDVITGLTGKGKREGSTYRTTCPLCGSQHGLTITPAKKIYKCFSCGNLSGKDPISFLMTVRKDTYPEAIEYLASHYGMVVEYEEERKKAKKSEASNFCKRMLTQSGLTYADVTATVKEGDNEAVTTLRTFVSGTLTKDGEIDKEGDDAVIKYYDLEGRPVTFTVEVGKKQVEKTYLRVRYQHPDRHLDKNKRPIKYRSPMGSPTFMYYPEAIRKAYRTGEELPTLFIQEGEKKAEKACKHGIMSVAVSGIQNIGHNGALPDDIIALVERCKVKEVVFMLDSDCYDITHTPTLTDPIEKRPSNFFYAVRNFKDYFAKLKNHNIYVELYFGHIRKEVTEDKGTDDLLTNTLKGKEEQLLADITAAKNEKSGTGQWVQLHKITTFPDSKIMEFWKLQSPHDFCKRYIEQLRDLPEFTFRGRRWKFNDKDELESAQPLEEDEMFWTEQKRKDKKDEYYFCYVGAKNFLEHRGYWRWKKPDGDYEFVHVADSIVEVVKHHEIADFVRQWTQDTLSKPVLEMLLKGGAQYLGPVSLSMLNYLQEPFEKPKRGIQRLYFANEIWEITADGIQPLKYSQQRLNIWRHQKKEHTVTLLPPLIHINRLDDGTWTYRITSEGLKCDFLRFLENASNFTWRKDPQDITPEERNANAQHLISKLAAFGYLVSSAKVASFSRAVIAMDGKQTEIGRSDGRTGKSLLGKAVGCMTQAKYYNGKAFAAGNNQFIWDGVDNRTRLVLIDDCQRDFDFEDLFGLISGDWPVNPKGAKPYTIPYSESPKVYITTNHAVTGDGASYTDRQWMLAFSDFYNAEHKPEHDFSSYFFEGWDAEQWDLFYNLVAVSLQTFFRYGYVATPGEGLEKRKLLQEIGDEFKLWADEYYAPAERPEDRDRCHLNVRIPRKEIYDDFIATVGSARSKFYTPKVFKTKLKKWCELEGLIYNPARFDPVRKRYELDAEGRPKMDDKSNSTEWITVGNMDFYAMGTTQPVFDVEQPEDELPIDLFLDTLGPDVAGL